MSMLHGRLTASHGMLECLELQQRHSLASFVSCYLFELDSSVALDNAKPS